MQLNEAVSSRVQELLDERNITQYRLYTLTGVTKSTISNIVHCAYETVELRTIHELCQGFGISITAFFDSPLFDENNLEP